MILLLLLLLLVSDPWSEVNFDCIENDDCIVENIKNCNGDYQKCINKNSLVPTHAEVNDYCIENDMDSVCDNINVDVNNCYCIDRKCTSV